MVEEADRIARQEFAFASNITFKISRTGPDEVTMALFDQGVRNILGPGDEAITMNIETAKNIAEQLNRMAW